MKIREARLDDLEEIQKLFLETIRSTCVNDYNEEQIEVWSSGIENKERWIGFIKNQYFILAILERRIVGFASLDFLKGDYLDFMYVHKDYLRMGIANKLLKTLEMESSKNGYSTLRADVSITARPFFEKKGFVVIKENVNNIKGVELINYRMKKVNINQPNK